MSTLRAAVRDRNVKAFLRLVRWCESSDTTDEAYRALFGWRPGNGKTFASFTDHPRIAIMSPWGWTSAAGAYQAMCAVPGKVKTDTWGDFIRQEGPHDFSPASQDLFAVWAIRRRRALDDVIAGRIEQAIQKCTLEWASFPGSPYGQPTRTMAQCLARYAHHGGRLEPQGAAAPIESRSVPKEKAVGPLAFIAAALPSVLNAAPKLIDAFKGDTEVNERNAELAKVVVEIAKTAIGASNEQDLVQRLNDDPTAREAVRQAVEAQWFKIHEAAEKSTAAAREFAMAYAQTKDVRLVLWNMTFLELLTLVFVIVGTSGGLSALFWGNVGSELKGMIIGLILVESVVGVRKFWFGNVGSTQDTELKKDRAAGA